MSRYFFIVAAVFVMMFIGCSQGDSADSMFNDNEILKLSVLRSGEIQVNNKVVSLKELDSQLSVNAQKNGVVWYYREAGHEEPPPEAMDALNLIIKHKRPISMSSKPDFSDTIDENGKSRPRNQ